jgi:DUF305 family protein family protein
LKEYLLANRAAAYSILNFLLIGNVAHSHQLESNRRCRSVNNPRAQSFPLEVNMTLLSRSLVRTRVISLATVLSVSAAAFAFAQDPTSSHHVGAGANDVDEQLFMFENDLAMSNMNRDMLVKPTGDIDRDFVAVMIPLRQGAIDMARAELKYGHNEELRRLAQNAITQQQHEIAVMRHAVGEAPATQSGEPSAPQPSAESDSKRSSAAINTVKMK